MNLLRRGPPKSASRSTENAPMEAKVAIWAFLRTLSANANSPGMTTAARIERFATASHRGFDNPHIPGRVRADVQTARRPGVQAPKLAMHAVHTTHSVAANSERSRAFSFELLSCAVDQQLCPLQRAAGLLHGNDEHAVVGLVFQVDQSNEGRSQLLAIWCGLLEQRGSGAVVLPAMDPT